MEDFLKRKLNIDDSVVFIPPYSKTMTLGRVVAFSPKMVRVVYHGWRNEESFDSYADRIEFCYSASKQEVIDKMKKSLDAKVSDVIASSRLVDSAACLVLSKDEPGAQLKRILEASGQSFGDSKPVFEVNLKHKLIKKLGSMSGKEFSNFSQFLFDYAVIAEGGTPKDPAKYLRQLDKYLS